MPSIYPQHLPEERFGGSQVFGIEGRERFIECSLRISHFEHDANFERADLRSCGAVMEGPSIGLGMISNQSLDVTLQQDLATERGDQRESLERLTRSGWCILMSSGKIAR